MNFTINNLTKFYWITLLIAVAFLLFSIKYSDGLLAIGILFLILLIFAIRSMSYQINVKGRKLSYKNLFSEKSINIIPESKIYIRRNIQSLFYIFRHYDYSIKVVNPNESLNINSNVNDADQLYELISQLEQKIIFPLLLERYTDQQLLMLDQYLGISTKGIKYKNKNYLYDSISSIEFENGYFRLLAEGKLWQTTVLALPISSIPNPTTFMTLIHLKSS